MVFTEATPVALLLQVTSCVMFCVLASLKIPTATNGNCVSGAIVCITGVTTTVAMVALVTVSVTGGALTDPRVAEIMLVPGVAALALPVAAMVATLIVEEAQVT